MVHWEAKCAAVKPWFTNTQVHTHLTALRDLCDGGRQRQGTLLHGTLDMIRSNSLKCPSHHDGTALSQDTEHGECIFLL